MKKYQTLLFLFLSLTAFAQLPNTLTPAEKVYGLSKFWQEVNYNFVYLNKIDRKMWDSRYKELITIVQNTKSDYEYYRELQKFCALLKDGHTNVFLPENIKEMNTMFGEYRLFIENKEGKAIITRTNYSKKDEIPIGSEVIEVNGIPTEEYRKEYVAPYISSSTDYVLKDWSISQLLIGLEGQTYTIKIKKPNNQIIQLRLTHKNTEEKEVFPSFGESKELLTFKWIDKKIAYLALNSFENKDIDSLFIKKLPELRNAKALIIDLRYNGGGNSAIGTKILEYLINDTILRGPKSSSRLHIPAFKAWGKYIPESDSAKSDWHKKVYLSYKDDYFYNYEYDTETFQMHNERVVIPTVLLIGHNTASAAEDFLIYADNQKHMTKIGENTYGSTGIPLYFDIPGGSSARVCTKKDTYPDGREFVGYGIKPDIEVIPTLKDFLNKRDAVLEKAIMYLNSKL